ncbi:MAG: thioredoxin domain-containing protein [Desulfovermiculus sp.]|nr:thioredoxin domain-containing protein [Desulfovermiculus sp.]
MSETQHSANRLIDEKSPYLLQHAYNPVDWHPWSEETFSLARDKDLPVFVSIGYATCHWCHVMERESFEDQEVAQALNHSFISIKVDREERPDIDQIYMTACQMISGRGGWPLTVIMTPDKRPFFAATYIPKQGRFGQAGLLDLLAEISRLWQHDREKISNSARQVTDNLQRLNQALPAVTLDESTLDAAFKSLEQRYDPEYGGFGQAPKFPAPHNLLFLLRFWQRSGNHEALNMVDTTLKAMRRGGIFDHLGFGFHRYSTDRYWLVPHFEKMLYDQAMLIMALTETYELTQDPFYPQVIEETVSYVLQDMTDASGAFYSAEDADSEGEEGKFYVWTEKEIDKLLSPEEARLAKKVFGLTPDGNFKDEASKRRTGANILHLSQPLDQTAQSLGVSQEDLSSQLEIMRSKLLAARNRRIRPLLDDKVLTDWNGLMISALAQAGRVLENEEYTRVAKRATQFILEHMYRDGRLLHRYREGQAAIPGMLDDYSFFIQGLIELHAVNDKREYLDIALGLTHECLNHFWDQDHGGFYLTPDDGEELLTRPKEITDGAIPSGNSVFLSNLLRLARISQDPALAQKANELTKAFSGTVAEIPAGCTFFLCGLDMALQASGQERDKGSYETRN